jgi:hypothetical protein
MNRTESRPWKAFLPLAGLLAAAFTLTFSYPAPSPAEESSPAAFDQLKALSGEWSGADEDKVPCRTHFEIASGGTAVMERLRVGSHPEMIDMYHLDGDKVMLTHYCNANNQPRMRQAMYDPQSGTLNFGFVDVTNLKDPKGGCMRELKLKMPDKDHLVEEWLWSQDGKQSSTVFRLERKQKS